LRNCENQGREVATKASEPALVQSKNGHETPVVGPVWLRCKTGGDRTHENCHHPGDATAVAVIAIVRI